MELAQIGKATAKMISENKRAGKGGELFQKMADKTLRRLAAIERVSEEKKSKKAVYSDPAKPGPVSAAPESAHQTGAWTRATCSAWGWTWCRWRSACAQQA